MMTSDPLPVAAHPQDLDSSLTDCYEEYFSFSQYLRGTFFEEGASGSIPSPTIPSEETLFLPHANVEQELSDNYLNLHLACSSNTAFDPFALAQVPVAPTPPPPDFDVISGFELHPPFLSAADPTFGGCFLPENSPLNSTLTYTGDAVSYGANDLYGALRSSAYPDARAVPACIEPALITAPSTSMAAHHPTAPGEPHPRIRPRRTPPIAPYPTPSPEPYSPLDDLIICKPRNVQVSVSSSSPSSSSETPAPSPRNRWQCPHCPHIQQNRRGPDLRRHIATHTRPVQAPQWVCCGVPVFDAAERGVPEKVLKEGELWQFDGIFMIGGCRKTFSRRDAYGRHLRREKGVCFGDPHALYQPGNVQDADKGC
ncbi:hypothetical protein C8T65DRAFT_618614 [Cerioporus squamosus]|nr:hypothetical protein C8T65DRAFT_618614 [Cerioporus squamosus]